MNRGILEREPELVRLAAAAREAADGAGSVVLVFGEAGIGKLSLVKALPERLPGRARVLVGEYDDLAIRRPLGPFRDLVGSVGAELARAVTLHEELAGSPHPTVLGPFWWISAASRRPARLPHSRLRSSGGTPMPHGAKGQVAPPHDPPHRTPSARTERRSFFHGDPPEGPWSSRTSTGPTRPRWTPCASWSGCPPCSSSHTGTTS